eukprot:NODE_27577_length_508_cov_2.918635.p1 GENE.NODE_27577_length_508_cov_2.918635~~NODE_27577_length_508_cov_2.918635.p1  ORF type:complete len:107 (-),score=23.83 NODE_27577_length_508_cov_2.918635:188-484(-)
MSVLSVSRKQTTTIKELKNRELGEYNAGDSGHNVLIAIFDVRGLEPVRWYPVGPWAIESEGGTLFTGVDLSDDWMDYCQKSNDTVSVNSLNYVWKLVR